MTTHRKRNSSERTEGLQTRGEECFATAATTVCGGRHDGAGKPQVFELSAASTGATVMGT